MTPVPATKVDHDRVFQDDVPDGAFYFKNDSQVWLVCPCGCKGLMCLAIRTPNAPRTKTPQWEWDGNTEAPTLAPSIRDLGGCRFHGHLQNGVWTFCSDSGQR